MSSSLDRRLPILLCMASMVTPLLAGAPAETSNRSAAAGKTAVSSSSRPATPGERLLRDVAKRQGVRNPDRIVTFYRTWNPAALAELGDAAGTASSRAKRDAQRLVRHYLELQHTRRRFPDEYERLLQIEKMESECLALGRKIRRLRIERKRAGEADRKKIDAEIDAAQKKLRQVLARVFDARQQNQTIAVTRLEAELRELRNLLQQRKVNRDDILANRFRQLAGADGRDATGSVSAPITWDW